MTKTYGPYSPSQTIDNLVFTAGQVGATNGQASDDIAEQTKLALQNLSNVLEAAGSSLSQVIKTTVYLTDMTDFDAMNKVYAQVFSEAGCQPSRSTVGVKELPRVANKTLLVEIDAIASLARD